MIEQPARSNALAPRLGSTAARRDAEWISRLIKQRTKDELVYAIRSTGCQGVPIFEFFEGTPCCSDADTCPTTRGELVLVARKHGMSSLVAPVSAAPLVSSGVPTSALFSYVDPALTPHVPVLTLRFTDSKGNKFDEVGRYLGSATPATAPFPSFFWGHVPSLYTMFGNISGSFSYDLAPNEEAVETTQNPCPDQSGTAILSVDSTPNPSSAMRLQVREYDTTPAVKTFKAGFSMGNYPTKFASIVPDPLNGGWWALFKGTGSRPTPIQNATVTLGRTMHRYIYDSGGNVLSEVLPRITLENAGTAWDASTFVTVSYEYV